MTTRRVAKLPCLGFRVLGLTVQGLGPPPNSRRPVPCQWSCLVRSSAALESFGITISMSGSIGSSSSSSSCPPFGRGAELAKTGCCQDARGFAGLARDPAMGYKGRGLWWTGSCHRWCLPELPKASEACPANTEWELEDLFAHLASVVGPRLCPQQ